MNPLAPATNPSATSAFDQTIQQRCVDSGARLRDTMQQSSTSPDVQQQSWRFIRRLLIHRNLFFHTYVHLTYCEPGNLARLVNNANLWVGYDSIQQLVRHNLIREKLLSFWTGHGCSRHQFLFAQHFAIHDDVNDLLCLLLYCCKKGELLKLSRKPAILERGVGLKESDQIVELLWGFLMDHQERDSVHRLRACIYRMARKSAYLPRSLQIQPSSLSNEHILGAGANGTVSVATMGGRRVIVKKILCNDHSAQRQCLEMFASEAILWGTLQHEYIVPFLGVVTQGSNVGLVAPFFESGSVRKYLGGTNPRRWPELAKRLSRDLAEALKYIHYHDPPIIHGDLKADNVLVDDGGHARLGDFGQSHSSDSGKYLDSTRVGLPSTPFCWMAPELMADQDAKAYDKSDIYSFGCVLYEMISGSIPFQGLSPLDVVNRVRNGVRSDRPRSISRDDPLWKVVEACWKHDPKGRPSARRLISLYS